MAATEGKASHAPGEGVNGKGAVASRYQAMTPEREPYLQRARRMSALTVPSLFRENGANGSSDLTIPWQSLGAYGVNSLAAKRILAMFPPGTSFVKLDPTRETLQAMLEMTPTERGQLRAEIDKGLSVVENELMDCMEEDGDRWRLFDATRHMMVGGNHALKLGKDSILQSIHLENYVTRRDKSGNLLEAIVEDVLSWDSLSEDIQEFCKTQGHQLDDKKAIQDDIRLYTHIRMRSGKFHVKQEVCGGCVPGTEATYNPEALPYLFLREVVLRGEHYGRSYVEDYEADLQTLDAHWQVLTEGGAGIAQVKWLVRPGGVTNKEQFSKLPNGGVMTGSIDDVAAARSEKTGDLAFMAGQADKIERRLEQVFLLYSSVQRNGERVTREEIITMRQDLDSSLGGIYANQETTFQQPYARLKYINVTRQGRVTKLPQGSVKMRVLTGAAGLGRQKAALDETEFLLDAASIFGPEVLVPYVSVSTYLSRSAANRSINSEGLILPEEEVKATQQQAQMDALAANVAPEMVKQGGQMLQNNQTQAAEAAPQEGA
jgi:hypothetical protein